MLYAENRFHRLGRTRRAACCGILDSALNDRVREDMDKTGAVLLPKSGEGMQLSPKLVTSIKARRHHIDLFSDNMPAEVERLLALGAQRVAWRYPEGLDYTALADPDGNRFCVVQK